SNQQEKDRAVTIRSITNRLLVYWEERKFFMHNLAINMAEFMHESVEEHEGNLQEEELEFAPAALNDSLPEVEDPLQEKNLGTEEDPRPTFISKLLEEPLNDEIIALLHNFKDCFAWHYHEMPGLDRGRVEHMLLIKEGYLPVKHARRRMSMETTESQRRRLGKLVKAGVIRLAMYADWLSNIVPAFKKKTWAVRICVDYRNLNEASPKDEYPRPMADMLVDGAAHNQMLSFMDGNAGYNQIMVAEEDIHKTAFMCPGHIGAFEYTIMPFGLRNVGATYQRAMNSVFHDMIGHSLEVYIDDVVIKSPEEGDHVSNLKKAFLRMRQHKLKMNPKKCVFGVQADNFLGFLVHQRGIEIDKNKEKSIMEALPPRNKKELQSLLGKINFLRRFISNFAGKIQPFSSLLRLKQEQTFKWEEQHQQAFKEIKHYLSNPPVMSPPKR
ncbi:PREDICTED: LOW QUALITY PROTEIN, partial [Prunus dulcis]